jgi:hypothetical protein
MKPSPPITNTYSALLANGRKSWLWMASDCTPTIEGSGDVGGEVETGEVVDEEYIVRAVGKYWEGWYEYD